MKRFLMINTMILALAATSAFAVTHKQAVPRSPKPAATQSTTGTATKATTSNTTRKKRHHKHKATKNAAEMKGGASKKN